MIETMTECGDQKDAFVGGTLNLMGVRPGEGMRYEGDTMIGTIWYSVTLTTTYDAIQKLVIPPPLMVDRDLPAEVRLLYFVNRRTRGYDGAFTPYQGLMLLANAVHRGRKGSAGWEYVDALRGDKTEMDIMGPWGVYFGMLKKMADIRFLPVTATDFEVTVDRRGTRLLDMEFSVGEELPAAAVAQFNAAMTTGTFTVREFPNENFSGYAERSVCWTPTFENKIERAWTMTQASLAFGALPLDPLAEMEVLAVSPGLCFQASTGKRIFTEMEVVERLPLSADTEALVAAD